MSEIGANRGFLISRAGFQTGACAAAEFTNLELVTWAEFEAVMFDRWVKGITRTLHPLMSLPNALMDTSDETLWRMRPWTAVAAAQLEGIIRRYPLLTLWSLFHFHSSAGLIPIPKFASRNVCRTRSGERVLIVDTYRKVIALGPTIARHALGELKAFWDIRG